MRTEATVFDRDHNSEHSTRFLDITIPDGADVSLTARVDADHGYYNVWIGFDHVTDLRPIADAIMDAIRKAERQQYIATGTLIPVEITERRVGA